MHTRSNAANMDSRKRQRFISKVSLVFNLCNEPWLKYGLNDVADRGMGNGELTSAKLMSHCLFLETNSRRYELTWWRTETGAGAGTAADGEAAPGDGVEVYRWSECRRPLPMAGLRTAKLPLTDDEIADGGEGGKRVTMVSWDKILWCTWGVIVDSKRYNVSKMLFVPRTAN